MTATGTADVGHREGLELLDLREREEDGVRPGVLVAAVLPLLLVATAGVLWPSVVGGRAGLVWVLALVPLFLTCHRKGWWGAALTLATGMAVLVGVEVVGTMLLDLAVDPWLFGLGASVFVGVALWSGWMSERLVSARASTLREALRLALRDPETDLPTRRATELFLEKEFAGARRGDALTLVLFDLDGFADFVEGYGRDLSRQVLEKVGAVFHETSREADLTGRWGSQEFLAVLPGEDERGAGTFAERVRTKADMLEFHQSDGTVLTSGITVSAGVAEFEEGMQGAEELLERTHRAMHAAKAKGGDSVVLFDRTAHGGAGRHASESTAGSG